MHIFFVNTDLMYFAAHASRVHLFQKHAVLLQLGQHFFRGLGVADHLLAALCFAIPSYSDVWNCPAQK
jgi:hypothetical protein